MVFCVSFWQQRLYALCRRRVLICNILGGGGDSLEDFHGAIMDCIAHCGFFEVTAFEEVIEVAVDLRPKEACWGIGWSEEGDA